MAIPSSCTHKYLSPNGVCDIANSVCSGTNGVCIVAIPIAPAVVDVADASLIGVVRLTAEPVRMQDQVRIARLLPFVRALRLQVVQTCVFWGRSAGIAQGLGRLANLSDTRPA